jgi:DNA-binding NtrC family response regulator
MARLHKSAARRKVSGINARQLAKKQKNPGKRSMEQTKKLLLVDDEADFRNIIGNFFNRRKIACETAASCIEALDWLGKDIFDVVIMDVSMPGLDGLACMAEIKKMWPDIEVIILTGHVSLNSGLIGMKQGAFDYCLKPVDFDELLEKVLLARKTGGMARA